MEDPKTPQSYNINTRGGNYIEKLEGNYIQNVTQSSDIIPEPTVFPQNIPKSNTEKFVGREPDLVQVHQYLEQNNASVIYAVQGMGGVGKTELATQYCLLHIEANTYPGGICWVRVRGEDVGLQVIEFTRLYLGLKPPEDLDLTARVKWCWTRWIEGKTLIVLDDVTDYSSIQPYLPPQVSRFKVLITTRLKLDLPGSLSLEVLSEPQALELLAQLIGSDKLNQELEKAKELCRYLGYLPLALQLVGRYVKKRKISLVEMLSRLEEKGLENPALDLEKDKRFRTLSLERGVKTAFELSWEELSPAAQELGCLLSLFASSAIPWLLVEGASPKQDVEELEDARLELEILHLLQGEDNYQLHQLIREFLKTKKNHLAYAEEQKSHFCQEMVKVAKTIPESPTQKDIKSVQDAIPHLAEVVENLIDVVNDESLTYLFSGLARYYAGQGLYAFAKSCYNHSLSLLKARLGEEHTYIANSYHSLAILYDWEGKYSEAEALCLKSLELRLKILGGEHSDIANSYNALSLICRSQGKYLEAESFCLKSLELRLKILGGEHSDIAESYLNLGLIYSSQGKYLEAESFCLKSLEIFLKILGEEHSYIATNYNILATIYYLQGKYQKAESFYTQSLELRLKLLGEKHLDVAESYLNLGLIYSSQGKYSETEPLYLKSLEILLEFLGEENPFITSIYNNLGNLYYWQGNYLEAKSFYIKSLDLKHKLLGEDHPDTATGYHNLALIYKSLGQYSEAESFYLKSLEIRRKLLGEEHPDVASTYNNLANVYESQNRYSEAESFYLKSLEIRRKLLGEEHPDVASGYYSIGLIYLAQDRHQEAEFFYLKSLEIRRKLLGEEHPDVVYSYNGLGDVYSSQGRYQEAKSFYLKSLEIAEHSLGMDHPNTIAVRKTLKLLCNKIS